MNLRDLRDTWNELGRTDAMWAVLTGPYEGRRAWDPAAFFQTGVDEVAMVLARAVEVAGPVTAGRALDFGCGIGRLSQALAKHFSEVHGVDIAPSMLEQARQHNQAGARCQFHLNETDSLSSFPDRHFDFIYSSITLQHMEPRFSRRFVQEFVRVVRPGGIVVFQVPSDRVPSPPGAATDAGPLPAAACRADIEVRPHVSCAPGARVRLPVRVRNAGHLSWPAGGGPDGARSVRLGNHWRHRFGWMVRVDDARAALLEDLPPGRDCVLELVFDAPRRGVHVLELDMVQEHVRWFADAGSSVTRVRVTVDPGLAPGTVVGIPPRMEMHGVPRPEVEQLLQTAGAELLAADPDDAPGPGWTSFRYFARRAG